MGQSLLSSSRGAQGNLLEAEKLQNKLENTRSHQVHDQKGQRPEEEDVPACSPVKHTEPYFGESFLAQRHLEAAESPQRGQSHHQR